VISYHVLDSFINFTFQSGIPHLAALHLNSLDMDTLDLRPSVMDVGVEARRRDELIHEHPRASAFEPRRMKIIGTHRAGTSTSSRRVCLFLIHVIGESYADPTAKSWAMNHPKVGKWDNMVGEDRREDTFAIFVTVSPSISFVLCPT
jgi:hypothetical protein